MNDTVPINVCSFSTYFYAKFFEVITKQQHNFNTHMNNYHHELMSLFNSFVQATNNPYHQDLPPTSSCKIR